MNPQLSALFAQHRTAVLGGGAVAVAALALWQKRKKATGAAGAATAGAAVPSIAGTIPAAAVVPGGSVGSGYDSSAYDVYNALQPQLEQLRQTQGTTAAAAPAPVASTLFAPTYDNNYVRYADGTTAEVESDGSLLWLNQDQYNQAGKLAGGPIPAVNLPQRTAPSKIYNTGENLAAKNT